MKRSMFLAFVLVLASAVSCFAIGAGIGVRAMGMGGTGIATANDITAAYFNPAGLMYGPENFECQLMGGGATQGLSDVTQIMSDMSNSDNLINNLLPKEFNVDASLNGGLGVSVRKVGLSALVTGNTNFSKKADQLDMNINGQVRASVPLTLGSVISTPGLPIASLAVGVNLKSLYDVGFLTTLVSSGGTATGSNSYSVGTGFGFDIGAQAKITPLISVGGVIRNLSASESVTIKSNTLTATLDAGGNAIVVETPQPDKKTTYSPAPEIGVGVGVVVPITGTLIAVDLENYSFPENNNQNKSASYTDTHIGLEQGVLFNLVMLRAGYCTYTPTEDTFYTYGIGFNLGPVNLGAAAANSVKDSADSVGEVQLGASF
jgi:hypothetical protein